jgi:DNA-binding transcriptional ArsR family regulator
MPKPYSARHSADPNVAAVAALIADPGRAAMLLALLDGRRLAASELAFRAGISPTAASAHLGKLVGGGMLLVERSGRQRLYQVAGSGVGEALEALAAIAAPAAIVALAQNALASRLRVARSCYDHLAGRLGVGVTDALVARRLIVPGDRREFDITRKGRAFFAGFGIDIAALENMRRPLARQCIDWSEHRAHIAGALGAALRERCFARAWVERFPANRALRITPAGKRGLAEQFGVEL